MMIQKIINLLISRASPVRSVPVRAYNLTPYGVTTSQNTASNVDNDIA